MIDQIIMGICGLVCSVDFVDRVLFRKANRKKHDAEAAKEDSEAQIGQMDVVKKYTDDMIAMVDTLKDAVSGGNEQVIAKVDSLCGRMDNVEAGMNDIILYLNGDFKRWRSSHGTESPQNNQGK